MLGRSPAFWQRRTAQRTDSLPAFHLALADHVEDKAEQLRFLNEVNLHRSTSERVVGGKTEARIAHDTIGSTALQPQDVIPATEAEAKRAPAGPILVASQTRAQSSLSGWMAGGPLRRVRGVIESLRRGWRRLLF